VAPLAADDRGRGFRTGARWGFGHAAGVLAVGGLALLLRSSLPLEGLSAWSERLVGVVLIGIGLWAARRVLRLRVHAHPHDHDGAHHAHIHVHASDAAHDHGAPAAHRRHVHAAFGIGALHGVAGSAHFLGVLPALALPTLGASVAYVLAFGAGSVLAMAIFAGLVAWAATRFADTGTRAYRALLALTSASAVIVGLFWLAA
jgi:ABC-type nickel/cobalt efflux system permease component RcnA